MIQTTVYCDRCGNECEKNRKNNGFHLFYKSFFLEDVVNKTYLDLCQKCYDELAEWMKDKKEK